MIKTSILKLDQLLDGGLKEGSVNCLWALPGSDLNPFIFQIVLSASKSLSPVFVVNTKKPVELREEMKESGFFPSNISIVDAYSANIKVKSSEKFVVPASKNPEELFKAISVALSKVTGKKLLVFDNFSTLIDLIGSSSSVLKAFNDFVVKQKGLTIIVLFTDWGYEKPFLSKFRGVFNSIVELKTLEEKFFIKHFFSVSKVDWSKKKLSVQAIPYRAMKKRGIKVYIPKILITGPFNAGKTSFIHSASSRAVSVDRLGTTIALDHGHCNFEGFDVDLFGTPGQERFDPILKSLGGEALGVIIVLSAVDPAGFDRAKEMMQKTGTAGLPYVVAVNKADLRGALSDSAIRSAMSLPQGVPIVRMTASDLSKVQPGLPCQINKEDINKVLNSIFNRLLFGGGKNV